MKKLFVRKYDKGFTLIELLVVVAIIGILTGIVITFVGDAKKRSTDAAVKGEMQQLQAGVEQYYLESGMRYASGDDCSRFADADISDKLQKYNVPLLVKSIRKRLGYDSTYNNADIVCTSGLNNYCFAARMTSDSSKSYCVDSVGFKGVINKSVSHDSDVTVACTDIVLRKCNP